MKTNNVIRSYFTGFSPTLSLVYNPAVLINYVLLRFISFEVRYLSLPLAPRGSLLIIRMHSDGKQRAALHQAIVDYVGSYVSPDTAELLRNELRVNAAPQDPTLLEKKWTAVWRLQKKVMELTSETERLKQELKESHRKPAQASGPLSRDWLPRTWSHVLRGHRGHVTSVAFHPAWSLLASACEDGAVKLWDTESGELERTLKAHTRAATCLDFSNDLLATCSADLTIKLWDTNDNFNNVHTLMGHEHTVSAVKFVKSTPSQLLSASRDTTVRVWNTENGLCERVLRMHDDWVRCLDVYGDYFVSAGKDKVALVSRISDPENAKSSDTRFEGHDNVIECCTIAPEATKSIFDVKDPAFVFATGGRDNIICIWRSDRPTHAIHKLVGHDNWVQGIAFGPSGKYLVSVSDDQTLRVWDVASGKCLRLVRAHDHFITSLAWRQRMIATASVDNTVKLWT